MRSAVCSAQVSPFVGNRVIHGRVVAGRRHPRTVPKSSSTVEVSPDVENLPLPGGTFGLPFVGETLDFLTDPTYVENRMQQYGTVFKSNLFNSKTVYIADADIINKIERASPELVVGAVAGPAEDVLGPNSLLLQKGEQHAFQRRLLMKTFSVKAIQAYVDPMNDSSRKALEAWASQGSILFVPKIKELILDVLVNKVIGLPLGRTRSEDVLDTFNSWWGGVFSLGINLPFTKFGKSLQARQKLIEVINEGMVIARSDNTDGDRRALPLLLNVKDDDGSGLNDPEIEDIVLLLMAAGYDTSAAVAIRMLIHLTKHPEVLRKIAAEQETVVAEHGDKVTKEALAAMPYLEAAIHETMRVEPPAPFGLRTVVKTFEINGYKIPAGWKVIHGFYSAMILEASRKDRNPFEFDPDRMLAEGGSRKASFLPFGTGVHTCIGQYLAMMQLKSLFSHLIRGYDFKVLAPDAKMGAPPFPEPVDKMPIEIQRKKSPIVAGV